MFCEKKNYLEVAKKHELAFRAILDVYKITHQDLSIEEIYNKYSEGDRYGIWTILDFSETEDGCFIFSSEDIATLSGSGRTDLWKIWEDKATFIKNTSMWMS